MDDAGTRLRARLAARHAYTHTPSEDEHDAICRYVMQPEIAAAIASATPMWPGEQVESVSNEVKLVEFRGRYRHAVGFCDVLIVRTDSRVIVEVKSGAVHTGAVIRQLKLYENAHDSAAVGGEVTDVYVRQFESTELVLVSAQPLTNEQIFQLRAAGVEPVVLGDAYTRWKAPPQKPALEI